MTVKQYWAAKAKVFGIVVRKSWTMKRIIEEIAKRDSNLIILTEQKESTK